ncbi:MAG: hypothetical protein K9L64_02030 [Candidatus Izimaplasma sp.]|nr:hypothetical protein [Candidatus Izimaplasma bacterium]
MENMFNTIKNDLVNYYKYHFISIIVIISLIFSMFMGITNLFPPMIYIYISVFIMPVITFSVSLLIESQQNEVLPILIDKESNSVFFGIGKIISATIIQLIPFVFYSIVLFVVLEFRFNILLFFLVYLLSIIMHIIIGLALSIISKSSYSLSLSYIVYLLVFSMMPIFYSYGFINPDLSFVLIISPAYLSGVLFESVVNGYIVSSIWLVVLAVLLQLLYISLIFFFIIKPFISEYLKTNYTD